MLSNKLYVVELEVTCPLSKWSFGRSFIFSITTVTTIGYGSYRPDSPSGKIACVVYSIIGIPLFLTFATYWTKALLHVEKKLR